MKVPQQALDLIKGFEGLHDGDKRTPVLEPQADPVGIYTIGWGHALFDAGKPVKDHELAMRRWRAAYPKGMTLADADELLRADAQVTCDRVLANTAAAPPLNDNQLSALVSFVYNVGVANFKSSTLRARVLAGNWQAAADEFPKWKFSGGKELPGLVARRAKERALFLKEPT
jgi:lysozyme